MSEGGVTGGRDDTQGHEEAIARWVDEKFCRDKAPANVLQYRKGQLTRKWEKHHELITRHGWRIRRSEGHSYEGNSNKRWSKAVVDLYLAPFHPDNDGHIMTLALVHGAEKKKREVHPDMMYRSETIMAMRRVNAGLQRMDSQAERDYNSFQMDESVECDEAALETVILYLYTGILWQGGDTAYLNNVENDGVPGTPDLSCNVAHVYGLACFLGIPSLREELLRSTSIDVFYKMPTQPCRDDVRAQIAYVLMYAQNRGDKELLDSAVGAMLTRTGSINLLLFLPFAFSQDLFETCIERAAEKHRLLWCPLVLVYYAAQFAVAQQWLRDKAYSLRIAPHADQSPPSASISYSVYYGREGMNEIFSTTPHIINYNEYSTGFCEPPGGLVNGELYSEFLTHVRLLQLRVCGAREAAPWAYRVIDMNLQNPMGTLLSGGNLQKQTLLFTAETHLQLDHAHLATLVALKDYESTRHRQARPSLLDSKGKVHMCDAIITAMSSAFRHMWYAQMVKIGVRDNNSRKRKFLEI